MFSWGADVMNIPPTSTLFGGTSANTLPSPPTVVQVQSWPVLDLHKEMYHTMPDSDHVWHYIQTPLWNINGILTVYKWFNNSLCCVWFYAGFWPQRELTWTSQWTCGPWGPSVYSDPSNWSLESLVSSLRHQIIFPGWMSMDLLCLYIQYIFGIMYSV